MSEVYNLCSIPEQINRGKNLIVRPIHVSIIILIYKNKKGIFFLIIFSWLSYYNHREFNASVWRILCFCRLLSFSLFILLFILMRYKECVRRYLCTFLIIIHKDFATNLKINVAQSLYTSLWSLDIYYFKSFFPYEYVFLL